MRAQLWFEERQQACSVLLPTNNFFCSLQLARSIRLSRIISVGFISSHAVRLLARGQNGARGRGCCVTLRYADWSCAAGSVSRQTSPTCCRTASGWLMWGPAVTVGLVHLQTGTSSRVYCVTAGLSRLAVAAQCSSTLRSPTLPFTPRVSLAEPGRVWKYHTLWSLHFWHPVAPRWQRSFVPVHVRLDLQSWMQCAQLLWRIPHLPPTSASSHWRTSSSACTLNNHTSIPPKKGSVGFWKQKRKNQQHVNQQHAAIPANFTHQLNNS